MTAALSAAEPAVSLYRLLDPDVLSDPYPLYDALRAKGKVIWDPYLHAWVVTSYPEVVTVLQTFSADRTPTPDQLRAMGMPGLEPVARVMVEQMLFLDPPAHTKLRRVCAAAFTSRRVDQLAGKIRQIAHELLDQATDRPEWDVLADFAEPLPAKITTELLGLPQRDWRRLKAWSATFAGLLGNFQHSPDQAQAILKAAEELTDYVRDAVAEQHAHPHEGLIAALIATESEGVRLNDEQIVANVIVTLVGGLETTTNLIASGLLSLIRHPACLEQLRTDRNLLESAIEELLRFESPSQHTARIAPADTLLGGQAIRKGDAVMAVMAAANRDPDQFPDPHQLILDRAPNRHVAFGWGAHFCFGAPLARLEGQIAFDVLLERVAEFHLAPAPLVWRENLGLRGLTALRVATQPVDVGVWS